MVVALLLCCVKVPVCLLFQKRCKKEGKVMCKENKKIP